MTKISIFLLFIFFICSCNKEVNSDITDQRNDSGVILDIPLSGSLQNPAFSPDGESIVFTRFVKGYNKEPADIYIFNLKNKQLTQLVSDGSGNVNLPGSVWNTVTHKIIFSSSREPHDEIFTIPENGQPGDEIKITNRNNKLAYEPSFNPDGSWCVFESHHLDEEAHGVICKYKINGSSPYIALSAAEDDCRQPNWSPAGNKILYQKLYAGQWEIWTMDTNGAHKLKVTTGNGDKTDAVFSSDGQFIYFSSDFEQEFANIYRISIQGTQVIRLTDYAGYDGAPSVSPDGKKIVFESFAGDPDKSEGTKLVLLDL